MKQQISSFWELDVFQKAYGLSLDIHKHSLQFPKIEQFALANQIRRSSKSVCANIAEGFAKQLQSKAEFKRFLFIAIGSTQETLLWARYALDLGYLQQQEFDSISSELESITRMLHSLRNKL